jgi:ribose transport system ATP-binding protein
MTGAGVAIVYISHRLDEVLEIADEVTVLRDGQAVLTRLAAGMTQDEMVAAIVGRPLADVFPPPTPSRGAHEAVLEIRGLSGGALHGVDLTLHAGEILGVAGLVGSGRTELLRSIFGSYRDATGVIRIGNHEGRSNSPAQAMRRGVAFVPENRSVEAVFPDLSVLKNLSIARLSEFARFGSVDRLRERADATGSVQRYRVRTRNVDAVMSTLSGGNQQKVVVARWLQRGPRILLLDEPTQGVDVGARADIYQLVRAAAAGGTAVILVSSDFEELAEMADRAIVLSDGRVVTEVPGSRLDRHTLTQLVMSSRRVHS